ncbi:MAG: hypothetical protein DRP15_02135 [Candidatus Aenigmatarchaeota archaeon]|nr:MAG: hypothetical protein DRP15_02135 [Candidatus Aenigmarchaeota archaeon]
MSEEYILKKRHFVKYYARYPTRRFIEVELFIKRDGEVVSRDWIVCGETTYVAELIFKYLIGRNEDEKQITREERLLFEQLKKDRNKWGLLSRILREKLSKEEVLNLFAIRNAIQ